jgi:superfamily I DNA and/or RNA helicase
VDKYQGQQNQYVLLSLVRTRAVGHLRDVRRLVVAMSRARLGLYIFGRTSLFASCYELQPTFRCGWRQFSVINGMRVASRRLPAVTEPAPVDSGQAFL